MFNMNILCTKTNAAQINKRYSVLIIFKSPTPSIHIFVT